MALEAKHLCFIGCGRVGTTFAFHFKQKGYPIISLVEKDAHRREILGRLFSGIPIEQTIHPHQISRAEVIFLTVPDDLLSSVIQKIFNLPVSLEKKIFIHPSGAYTSKILQPLKERGAFVLAAHPIYSFREASPMQQNLNGVYFDAEGDEFALTTFHEMAEKVGAQVWQVTPEQKLPIHLASVFYSNYLVGLAAAAQDILRQSEIPPRFHFEPFEALLKATLQNLRESKPEEALTGPLKRGDIHTIEQHLDTLLKYQPGLLPLYVVLARYITLRLVEDNQIREKLLALLDRFDV